MSNLEQLQEEVLKEFVEAGAALEHDRWARWQNLVFRCSIKNEDGTITIPKEKVDRWFRQIDTPYAELSEPEKESDRNETRNYLPLVDPLIARAFEEGRKVGMDYFLTNYKQTK